MLKQKRIKAIVLAYCLLLCIFFFSKYVLDFSKSLADRFPIGTPFASYQKFHVIVHDLDEMGDLNAECKAQLGGGVRLADWNDLVAFYEAGGSLDDLISTLKISLRNPMFDPIERIGEPTNAAEPSVKDDQVWKPDPLGYGYRVSKDGNLRWQGRRHYFVERHDHFKRPDFLDHDDLNNHQLTLGSWYGKGGYALCYGELIAMPIPLSKALKVITRVIAILLVGCLLLCSVLAAMHVLNIRET